MSKISPKISKVREIHPVGKRLNHMYQSCTEICTEVDSFTACAYLCTEVDLYCTDNQLQVPSTDYQGV